MDTATQRNKCSSSGEFIFPVSLFQSSIVYFIDVAYTEAPLRQRRFSEKKNLTIFENKNLGGNPLKKCD